MASDGAAEAVLSAEGCAWSLALQLMEDMARQALWPNGVTRNAALRSLRAAKERRRALELLRKAKENDVVGYATVIGTVSWAEALKLLQEMAPRRLQVNVVSRNAAMGSCESLGESLDENSVNFDEEQEEMSRDFDINY